MKRRSASSEISSDELQAEISIYDVPTVTLEAREAAFQLQSHPDQQVREFASQIIEKLSLAIRAMGKGDIGLVSSTGNLNVQDGVEEQIKGEAR
jgi:hypothetical protein